MIFPDGTHLAVSDAAGIEIIDISTGQAQTIPAPAGAYQLQLTPDGDSLLFTVAPFTGHHWFPFVYSLALNAGASNAGAVRQSRGSLDVMRSRPTGPSSSPARAPLMTSSAQMRHGTSTR